MRATSRTPSPSNSWTRTACCAPNTIRQPGDGAFPTTSWVQGEVLSDTYQLELPADLAPGSYRLIVRMYDPTTLAVLPATGADGGPAGDCSDACNG